MIKQTKEVIHQWNRRIGNIPFMATNEIYKLQTCPQNWVYDHMQDNTKQTIGAPGLMDIAYRDALKTTLQAHKETPQTTATLIETFDQALEDITGKNQDEHLDTELIETKTEQYHSALKTTWKYLQEELQTIHHVNMSTDLRYIVDEEPVITLGYLPLYATNKDNQKIAYAFYSPNRMPAETQPGVRGKLNELFEILHNSNYLQQEDMQIDQAKIIYATTAKTTKLIETKLELNKNQLGWAEYLSRSAWQMITKNQLKPNPIGADWKCQKTACSHYAYCPATRQ